MRNNFAAYRAFAPADDVICVVVVSAVRFKIYFFFHHLLPIIIIIFCSFLFGMRFVSRTIFVYLHFNGQHESFMPPKNIIHICCCLADVSRPNLIAMRRTSNITSMHQMNSADSHNCRWLHPRRSVTSSATVSNKVCDLIYSIAGAHQHSAVQPTLNILCVK